MSPAAAAAKLLQSCPTLSDPMDCSLPGSSIHGIVQARVLEWVAIAFSTVGHKLLQKQYHTVISTENSINTIITGPIF